MENDNNIDIGSVAEKLKEEPTRLAEISAYRCRLEQIKWCWKV